MLDLKPLRWHRITILLVAFLCAILCSYLCPQIASATETPLVTGNGFGFAVYSQQNNAISRFYAHPYKFEKADQKNPLSEGIETQSFVKILGWNVEPKPGMLHPSFGGARSPKEVMRDNSDKKDALQAHAASSSYIDQSHIIQSRDSEKIQSFFLPFGLSQNVLVTTCDPANLSKDSSGKPNKLELVLHSEWAHKVANSSFVQVDDVTVLQLRFEGMKETLVLVPLANVDTSLVKASFKNAGKSAMDLRGAGSWAFLSLENAAQLKASVAKLAKWKSEKLVDHELADLNKWRVAPSVKFQSDDERKLWRQSETVLRMAQIREPENAARHNHGLILASLPDGAWFVPWVRDMAYATFALIEMGHKDEAKAAIEAFLNARPVGQMQKDVGNLPYQVSVVRYFGDGSEEAFFTMEGSKNIELDDWGLVLWALGDYVQKYKDDKFVDAKTYRGTVYENAKKYIALPLLANLESYGGGLIVKADTSIWEEKQKDKKHFAFSNIAAINGLSRFAKIAEQKGDKQFHEQLLSKISLLKKGFAAAFTPAGKLRGALEPGIKNEVDGAALAAITSGLVTNTDTIKSAVADMQRLKMPSGGYRRVTSIVKDPKIFEYWYERQEFLFIDFLMAEIYTQLGLPDKAAELINPVLSRAAKDNYFIPEMFVSEVNYRFTGAVGSPTGAVPMVGYGAGVFILYALDRQQGHAPHPH